MTRKVFRIVLVSFQWKPVLVCIHANMTFLCNFNQNVYDYKGSLEIVIHVNKIPILSTWEKKNLHAINLDARWIRNKKEVNTCFLQISSSIPYEVIFSLFHDNFLNWLKIFKYADYKMKRSTWRLLFLINTQNRKIRIWADYVPLIY